MTHTKDKMHEVELYGGPLDGARVSIERDWTSITVGAQEVQSPFKFPGTKTCFVPNNRGFEFSTLYELKPTGRGKRWVHQCTQRA